MKGFLPHFTMGGNAAAEGIKGRHQRQRERLVQGPGGSAGAQMTGFAEERGHFWKGMWKLAGGAGLGRECSGSRAGEDGEELPPGSFCYLFPFFLFSEVGGWVITVVRQERAEERS